MRSMYLAIRILLFSIVSLFSIQSFAQTSFNKSGCKPPINRVRWHELIDKEQKAALRADGKADNSFSGSEDESINYFVTQALVQKTDALQCKIELDSSINHQKKVAYLSGLEKLIKGFNASLKAKKVNAASFPGILDAYDAAVSKDKYGASIQHIIEKLPFEPGNIIIASGAFDNNAAFKLSREILLRKYAQSNPDRIFSALMENPDVPFRDSLILIAGYKFPRQLYDFAQANNKLGFAIRKIEDPLIQAVVKMAKSNSGQLYFPFLDNILKGKQSIEEIDAVKDDHVKYYKLLVKTRIDYVQRIINKESVYEMEAIEYWLGKKAKDYFVHTINELHNETDAVRFRILNQLSPEELYYLVVYTESDIYTSSYTRGVYPIMMQKVGNRGDSLLQIVNFDRFKKFIRMAAGFNTLSDFLNSFPDKGQAERLMTAFVNGLENASGLEDGVDVADSYASIAETMKPLAEKMLQNVKANYDKNVAKNNRRGVVMYNLLYKLFLSADSTNNVDLSKEFGIPPVYNVNYNLLAEEAKPVVMQVFFYGDVDGRIFYQAFARQFANASWKITDNPQWITITSTRGKPITIYANKPLDEEKNLDSKAQEALMEHLAEKNIEPTIVVHRGHSYYAPYTIKNIQPSAKIVFLGSCGGYNLIHDVLSHAPDAHIIASKQIGKGSINQAFFDLLNQKLLDGNNIDWIPFWSEFKTKVGVDGFEDYIPPHKNLGVIFIKAYKTQMGDEGGIM